MKSKIFRLLKHGLLSALILLIIATIVSFFSIYSGVKKACLMAKKEFSRNCQSVLVQYIESENYSFRKRNKAIWVLGQLADQESVSFLEKLNSSVPVSSHCDYGQTICSYEIEKAIKWSRNGNLTSWMYRNQEKR